MQQRVREQEMVGTGNSTSANANGDSGSNHNEVSVRPIYSEFVLDGSNGPLFPPWVRVVDGVDGIDGQSNNCLSGSEHDSVSSIAP